MSETKVMSTVCKIINFEDNEFEIRREKDHDDDSLSYNIFDNISGEHVGLFYSRQDLIDFLDACLVAAKELD